MNLFVRNSKSDMKIGEVDLYLSKLRIPTSLVFTPINLKGEREKFLNSDIYEPNFRYKGVRNGNEEIFKKLSSLKSISDVDPRISDFYISLIESKKDADLLMRSVGDNELVTEISIKKFGKPSDLLFRKASQVLRGNVGNYNIVKYQNPSHSELLEYDRIEEVFNTAFTYFNLTDWKLHPSSNIGKNGAKIGIKSKWVLVDSKIEKSVFKLKKTLVHEVGTHILRSVNGQNSGVTALSNANLPSYLDVEEGLATWNESLNNLLTLATLKKKAAFTYAIYVGEKMSFRQLYNSLLSVFPPKSAFDITYRVKRGITDCSYPGIYAKDIVYFRGFNRVKKAIEKDKSLYEKLYAGKIDIKQCEWVDDGLIPKAKIVPSKEQWSEIFQKAGI